LIKFVGHIPAPTKGP